MTSPNFPYPKGSRWRRWDLQVQTILDDNYISLSTYYEEIKQDDPIKWDSYVSKVGGEESALKYDSKDYFNDQSIEKEVRCLNYVRNFFAFADIYHPDLRCIGLTDHNYDDDCLLDTFIKYAEKANLKAIPGVELNCNGIHILTLFPESLSFYKQKTISLEIKAFLQECGINERKSDGVLTPSLKGLTEVLDEIKRSGGIPIYPHCNSNNGLFQEPSGGDRTVLAEIFNHQKVNLLQTKNKSGHKALDLFISSKDKLKSEFCTHISSDARALKDLGKSDDGGNYLWIKADPSFEGLKQIIFEHKQRVEVNPSKPDQKKSYYVIDSARFVDNRTPIDFPSDKIEINSNLTTIIGGKSTGKSLLLYYIAKTIDRAEVKRRTSGLPVRYDLDQSADFDFEVTWADKQKSILKSGDGNSENDNDRKILYIPQKYLNTLSETNLDSRMALNEFILNIILQEKEVSESYWDSQGKIKIESKNISNLIVEIGNLDEDIKKASEELKQAGDEKGVSEYIESLKDKSDKLKKRSGLGEQALKRYGELTDQKKTLNDHITNLNEDKKTLSGLINDLSPQFTELLSLIRDNALYLNNEEIKKKYEKNLKFVELFEPDTKKAIKLLIEDVEKEIQDSNTKLLKLKGDLAPLLEKVELQSEIISITEDISKEEKKLKEINIKRKALNVKLDSKSKKVKETLGAYKKIFEKFEELRSGFKKFESTFGDLKLGIHIGFDEDSFNSNVVADYLNKNDLKRNLVGVEWSDEFVYQYNQINHLKNISLIFHGLTSGKIKTVKNRNVKDALLKLLENYFDLDFRIYYKDDSLDMMSPGKRGLVLLRLLISLSNEEWPILLDQPEDDLDNRSVYEDLVTFIKEKKIKRQIIIVTHNPNLTVGADAEEVIVANQRGQETDRGNKKYRFEYVSGAIENSFEIEKTKESAILYRKGIRQHVCEVLEGGEEAFIKREQKYGLN